MSFGKIFQNLLFLLLIMQFLPIIIGTAKKQYAYFVEQPTQVGVVKLSGEISSTSAVNKQLQTFFKDDSIKAILLRCDSPGGSSAPCKMLYDDILALKQEYKKPIITLVEDSCASGSYLIALATDYIIAPSFSIIGCIGVTMAYQFHIDKVLSKYDINYEDISSGEYKTAGNPFVALTDNQRKHLKVITEDLYQQFIDEVSFRRGIARDAYKEWAEGKVFTARQALKLGLIDAIGSSQSAIKVLTEKAHIPGKIEWVHAPQESGWSKLFGSGGQEDQDSFFAMSMNSICSYLEKRYTPVARMASSPMTSN